MLSLAFLCVIVSLAAGNDHLQAVSTFGSDHLRAGPAFGPKPFGPKADHLAAPKQFGPAVHRTKVSIQAADTALELHRSALMSELAYAGGTAKNNAGAAAAVEKKIASLIHDYTIALKAPGVGPEEYRQGKAAVNFLKSLRVEKATLDAVALRAAGDSDVLFGFRGTAKLRDLVPDAQLAFNKQKIQRLEEAKQFVRSVMRGRNGKFVAYGHSLGGFLAEGVSSSFAGARSVTMNAGVPRFNYRSGVIKSYGDSTRHVGSAIRFMVKGDLVSANGVKMGNAGTTHWFGSKARFNVLKNHKLAQVADVMKSPASHTRYAARKYAANSAKRIQAAQRALRGGVRGGATALRTAAAPVALAVAVAQAGKIASESVADKLEFERKLREEGVYDEQLAERLRYAFPDMVLGRGSTKAIVETCSGQGSVLSNTKNCLSGAKNMTVALGGLAKDGVSATARCIRAGFSSEETCALSKKETWVKAGEGAKKLASSVGDWFSTQYSSHASNLKSWWSRRKRCRASDKAARRCEQEEAQWERNKARAHANRKQKT